MYELTLESNHTLSCKCIFTIFLKGGLCKSFQGRTKKNVDYLPTRKSCIQKHAEKLILQLRDHKCSSQLDWLIINKAPRLCALFRQNMQGTFLCNENLNVHNSSQFPMLNVIIVLNFLHNFLQNNQLYSWRCFQDFFSRIWENIYSLKGNIYGDTFPMSSAPGFPTCRVFNFPFRLIPFPLKPRYPWGLGRQDRGQLWGTVLKTILSSTLAFASWLS